MAGGYLTEAYDRITAEILFLFFGAFVNGAWCLLQF